MENPKAEILLSPSIVRWAIGKEPTPSYTSLVLGRDLLCPLWTRVTWGKLKVDNFLCVVSECLWSDVEKEESVPFLDDVNSQVWDVSSPGLAINVPPVKILLRPNAPTPGKDNIP